MSLTPSASLSGTFSANGNSTALAGAGGHAAKFEVSVYLGDAATFGSGTVALQASPDGGTTWFAVASATFNSGTANTLKAKYTCYGTHVRLALTGATGPDIDYGLKAEVLRLCRVKQLSFTVDATGSSFDARHEDVGYFAYGTWGSGTMKLQASYDGGTTWVNIETSTADEHSVDPTNSDKRFRFVLSGSTNPALTIRVFD